MISTKKLASAVGGKTARACDSCIKKRARWYCAADDAFLCQACDSSVHSANLLAGRHERVRLKTASASTESRPVEPSWHNGFKRKPRTPRKSKSQGVQKNQTHLVPEMGQDENSFEENDEQEQLLYRVPILDLFADQLCLPGEGKKIVASDEDGNLSGTIIYDCAGRKDKHSLHGSGLSNNDIDEFAADVESLLGKGLDEEESFDMETLGFLDYREKDLLESCNTSIETVKLEEKNDTDITMEINIAEIDITGEKFELNFDDYGSLDNCEEDNKAGGNGGICVEKEEFAIKNDDCLVGKKKNIFLALDYEGVISAWAEKKRPWVIGDGRPEVDLNNSWPDCMDACGRVDYQAYGEMGGSSNLMVDEGRQARVLRYKEKRRRRLFSKKISFTIIKGLADGYCRSCRRSKSIHERLNGSHKFTIKDYSLVKQHLSSPGQYISSDKFTVGGYDWGVYFYPHGKYVDDNSDFVSVFIVLLSEGTNVRASFKLILLDQSCDLESHRSLHTWHYRGSMWGYRRFFYRTGLESSNYLKDDCLSMHCTVGVIVNRIERPIPIPPSDMSQSLKYLVESEIGSDIVFIVAGETFKAHKLILAARSPVFRAQFFGEVGNTNMNQVTLEEIDPPIFKAILLFIYSDVFPNIHEFSDSTMDSASTVTLQHLLAAADRFGLDRLKQLCEAKLCDELSADTVATTLLLADQHRCSQLKAICLKFAAANIGAFLKKHVLRVLSSRRFFYN